MVMQAEKEVFTELGRGRIAYHLPDGTLLVIFPHGSGQIFRPEDLFDPYSTLVQPRQRDLFLRRSGSFSAAMAS